MTDLYSFLESYSPRDEEQQRIKSEFLKFISRAPAPLSRENLEGHLTASALLFNSDETKVLLTHHRKLGKWLQLGGHADGDSDLLRVALKEGEEESGIQGIVPIREEIIDLDIHEIPARNGVPKHLHYDVRFILRVPSQAAEDFTISDESLDLRWFTRGEVALISHEPSLIRFVEKAFERCARPLEAAAI